MARRPRIDFPGAYHHVMNRGADHQITFRNDDDRALFLTLWSQAVVRFGIVVISFCLMDNHYHFLVLSPDGQLSRALQFIARSYTQQFNHHHGRDGALFRGRFHSVLVDSDIYLDRVARYIELNPVPVGLARVDKLEKYPWSSFQYHAGFRSAPTWLSGDLLLEKFGSREQFDRFVRSDMSDNELDRFYRTTIPPGTVLGSTSFVARVESEIPPLRGLIRSGIPEISLDTIEATVLRVSGAARADLRASVSGRRNVARAVATELGQLLASSSLTDLAERFDFPTEQAVSNVIHRWAASRDTEADWLRTQVLRELGRRPDGTIA